MTPQIVTCANRADWLKERAKGLHPIGSSDVPRILKTSPYGGPWSVWRDRFHPTWEEEDDSAHLTAGLDDEPRALAWYAWTLGPLSQVDPVPWTIVRHAGRPWMTCSPDAVVWRAGAIVGGVELKHLDHEDRSLWAPTGTEWRPGDPKRPCPRFIVQQATWCAIVCDTPWWDITGALWSGGRYPDTRIYRIHRTDASSRKMVAAVEEWRQRHLVDGVEPEFDTPEEHVQSVQRRHPEQLEPRVVEADASTAELLAQLGRVTAERKAYKALELSLSAQVCEVIGGGKAVRSPGWSASWSVSSTVRRMAGLGRIEAEHPDLVPVLEGRGLISTAQTARRLTLRPRTK